MHTKTKTSKTPENGDKKRDAIDMKESLLHTRKVIAKKFKELRQERMSKQKKYEEKLAPVTKPLKKIISKRRLNHHERNDRNDRMEVDSLEEFALDGNEVIEPPPEYAPPIPPRDFALHMDEIIDPPPEYAPQQNAPPIPPRARELNLPTIPRRQRNREPSPPQFSPPRYSPPRYDPVQIPAEVEQIDFNELGQASNTQMNQFFDDIIEIDKRNKKSLKRRGDSGGDEEDIFDVSRRRSDAKTRKHQTETMNFDSSDDGAYGGIDPDQETTPIAHSSQRYLDDIMNSNYDDSKTSKKSSLKGKHKGKLTEFSPEDYDYFGDYIGPGLKRSKLELNDESVNKSTIRRVKSRKLLKDLNRTSKDDCKIKENVLKQNFNRYKTYLKSVSPGDFDENGKFIGGSKRERQLSMLVTKIDNSN